MPHGDPIPATDRQRMLIDMLQWHLAMDQGTLRAFVDDQCPDVSLDTMTSKGASELITALQRERNSRTPEVS